MLGKAEVRGAERTAPLLLPSLPLPDAGSLEVRGAEGTAPFCGCTPALLASRLAVPRVAPLTLPSCFPGISQPTPRSRAYTPSKVSVAQGSQHQVSRVLQHGGSRSSEGRVKDKGQGKKTHSALWRARSLSAHPTQHSLVSPPPPLP